MTKRSSWMSRVMVFILAIAVVFAYSVMPMSQAYAAAAKAKKPAKVSGVKAEAVSSSSVKVTWKKAKNAKKYQIYVSTNAKKNFKRAATVKASARSYTVKKYNKKALKANKKYYFKVRAINGKKKGKFSKTVSKKTLKKSSVQTATSAEFASADFKVDARTADSYAGWALGDDKNGGHIEGAVNISAQWLVCDYNSVPAENKTRDEAIKMEIDDSGITTSSNIVVYDTNDKDAEAVAAYLIDKGYKNTKKYNASAEINADGAKLVSYKNYKMNVPAEVVKSISDFKVSGTALSDNAKAIVGSKDAKSVKILHAEYAAYGKYTDEGYKADNDIDWTQASYYTNGHVPGAEPISTDDFEPERESGRAIIKTDGVKYGGGDDISWIADYLLRDNEGIIALVNKYGIKKDDCVVVVGGEPMATTKIALVLRYAGVNDIHVMSAAYNEWNLKGYSLEKGKVNAPTAGTDITSIGNPDLIDTQEEAVKLLNDSGAQLVDTRTVEEFAGTDSGYSYHDIAGKIDGTINSPSGIGYSSGMYFYRNPDKTMRSGDLIEAMWKKQGVDPSKHMSFFCGSGWRAAEETWDAWVLGYENASLYNDGWQGWSNSGRVFTDKDGKKVKLDAGMSKLVDANADVHPDFQNMNKETWDKYGIELDKVSLANDFIIDVRPADMFEKGHFVKSANVPVGAGECPAYMSDETKSKLDEAVKNAGDKRIVVVCVSGNKLARNTLSYLQMSGVDMSKVTYLIGGAKGVEASELKSYLGVTELKDTDFVIDVRSNDDYNAGHVDGSVNSPILNPATDESKAALKTVYDENKDKNIVIVCVSGNQLALNALSYLQAEGADMSKITYLIGGAKGLDPSKLVK